MRQKNSSLKIRRVADVSREPTAAVKGVHCVRIILGIFRKKKLQLPAYVDTEQ